MREISWRFSSSGNGRQRRARAQARLDVPDRDAQVEGGQRGGDRRRWCRLDERAGGEAALAHLVARRDAAPVAL